MRYWRTIALEGPHAGETLLHIVDNIVTRRFGGQVALSSARNRGTTFRLTLALVAPRQDAAADQATTITDG